LELKLLNLKLLNCKVIKFKNKKITELKLFIKPEISVLVVE